MTPANTVRLRQLMVEHKLSCARVAELLDVTLGTVHNWHSAAYPQTIPDYRLELLELKVDKLTRGCVA